MNYIQKYYDYHDLGEQDIPRCEVCGMIASDVHHIIFRSAGGKDDVDNLIFLCRFCHDCSHHKQKPYLTKEDLYERKGNSISDNGILGI